MVLASHEGHGCRVQQSIQGSTWRNDRPSAYVGHNKKTPYNMLANTPPRTVFQADFPHYAESTNAERCVYEHVCGNISTRVVQSHHFRCYVPRLFGRNSARKSRRCGAVRQLACYIYCRGGKASKHARVEANTSISTNSAEFLPVLTAIDSIDLHVWAKDYLRILHGFYPPLVSARGCRLRLRPHDLLTDRDAFIHLSIHPIYPTIHPSSWVEFGPRCAGVRRFG